MGEREEMLRLARALHERGCDGRTHKQPEPAKPAPATAEKPVSVSALRRAIAEADYFASSYDRPAVVFATKIREKLEALANEAAADAEKGNSPRILDGSNPSILSNSSPASPLGQRFNVNDHVWLKLTAHGREILVDHFAKYARGVPALEERDGYSRFQMWEAMHIFGHRMFNGAKLPFETEILVEVPRG